MNLNGTGPQGQGSMTGRGLGVCGRGQAYGRGMARGMGRGFGRGLDRMFGFGYRQPTKSEETTDTKAYIQELEAELKDVQGHLKNLGSNK
jgi:hypothetical protein